MTASQELLTLLKTQHDDCTLYALHKILCVTTQNIYEINNGESEFSSDTVLICCDVLGIDPQPWLLRIEITRCRSPKRRQIMERMLEEFDKHAGRAVAGFALFFLAGFSQFFGA